ncbi:hypothetical protein [Streptomyces sp. NPDC047315]|uniref:hypothetical protein n=1 Tax=Streptomyces sp. NPDC047315 TaxID=3155142 RepID=UPI003402E0A8
MTTAVLAGLVYAVPAAAEEPGDNPADPWQRSLRISLGSQARNDRCQVARAVPYGGPEVKTLARDALTGSDADLRGLVAEWSLGRFWEAHNRDIEAAQAAGAAYGARQDWLANADKTYRDANTAGGREFHVPEFGLDVLSFTFSKQRDYYTKIWESPKPRPGQAPLDQARKVFDAFDTGEDRWATAYKPVAGYELFGVTTGTPGSANDIATFLRFGGFPAKAPEPNTPEFRAEVEALKMAWSVCDSDNPVDHYRALTGPVLQAHTEWEAEYASQATQRREIVTAEAAAAKEVRVATDAMMESIRLAWLSDRILFWQKYWADNKDSLSYPSGLELARAQRMLSTNQGWAAAEVRKANEAVARAKAASEQAAGQQTAAWAIADQTRVPRGRGLMHAQQSVQVAKASYAATQAAAKTAETAAQATNATVSTSATLLALAQTQSHALATEFRKAAAQEAATQAKAAADSAEKLAKEAADNAATAKKAQTTAEAAEQTAKSSAAVAKKQRDIAEKEKVTAAAEAGTAANERAKAQAAENRAQTERATAGEQRAAADTAGATAAAKRQEAENAEHRASQARDAARRAEKQKSAAESRAKALEAAAAAAEGSSAAGETRQAATEARTAANQATTAATRARTAANDATTAAVNARAAATRAQAAASRAQSAADSAWSAYMTSYSAAQTAHAAAAEAIDAAAAAQENAKAAEAEAKKAQTAAAKARTEATAAQEEAAKTRDWAIKTAGYAYATAQSSLAARDAADAVVKAADQAISLGTPYREADLSAAFAVLIGQTSKTLAEQQAASAKAKSDEAGKAAAAAKALADKATGDAKIAAQAAYAAALDAERALRAMEAARASAAQAAASATAAQQAGVRAGNYSAQTGEYAVQAATAANAAANSAAAAERDATDAEKDATQARSAATAAETDATNARNTATKAETDATAAETAAKNADTAAKDADAAATRAEEEARKRTEALHAEWVRAGAQNAGPALGIDDETLLRGLCGQVCVDEFNTARALAAGDVIDWIRDNGGEILIELFGVDNIIACVSTGEIESCLWALVDAGSIVVGFLKAPAVVKAIERIVSGINTFYSDAKDAKRTLERYREKIEEAKGNTAPKPPCMTALAKTGANAMQVNLATSSAGGGFDGWPGWEGWAKCVFIPTGQNLPAGGAEVALDTLALRSLREFHFAGGGKVSDKKGIFNSDLTLADMRSIFDRAMKDQGTWKQASGGPLYHEKNVCLDPKKKFGTSSKESGEHRTHCLTIVVSEYGDLVTMYPIRSTT